ncbi:MAG: flagellar hook-length control protein FliK [Minwuia sp.]|nr:flagellar hook-length control protein FliK [Minwuia sp.]
MQPNVLSSAPSSSPAVALKASQQMGAANDDSRRANSADRPSKSEFAKMVNSKDKPAETHAPEKDARTQATKSEKVNAEAKAGTEEEGAKATGSANTESAPRVGEAEATADSETAGNVEAAAVEGAVVVDQVETVVGSGTPVAAIAASEKSASNGTNVTEEAEVTSDDVLKPTENAKTEKSAATDVTGQRAGSGAETGATAATPGAEAPQTAAVTGSATGTATDAAATPAPLKDPAQETLAATKAGSAETNAVKADEAGTSARAVDRPAASGVAREDAARISTVEGAGREGAAPDPARANATATATTTLAAASQGAGEQVPQTNVAAVNTPQAIQNTAAVQQLATAAPQAQVPDAPVQQLAVHVTRAAKEGADRIEIQLKPAELGRVDVKLEVGHDGRVQAVVSAERADTLDLLRRDVQQLERALTHAGFNTDKDSFSFAERGGEGGRGTGGRGDGQGDGERAADDQPAESANDNRRRMAIDRPGVDVKV